MYDILDSGVPCLLYIKGFLQSSIFNWYVDITWNLCGSYFQGSYFQPFLVHLVRVVMVNGGRWLMMTWFSFSADCSSSRESYWIWNIDGIKARRLLTFYEGIRGFGQDSSESELFRQFEQNWAACDVWNPPIDKRYISVCPWFAL